MNSHQKQQLSSLAANLWHDWILTLNESDFKKQLVAFNEASGGVLEAAKTILTAKLLLKEQNLQEKKS
ncbi:MAG: hypothetical protein WDA26_08535 [Pusillimonas sp.]